ncbi:hypothetical protein EZS27_030073 [termite gut metagenome]|uniref:DUF3078 domain-containing protein n=1 Tax=termite gut metagenome TaxID=433724 RepID=A0A5J4QF46_9ZZZZ
MRITCTLLLFIILLFPASKAQAKEKTQVPDELSFIIKKDTFPSLLYQKYFGILDSLYHDTLPPLNLKLDADYYRLFVPLAYYNAPIKQLSEMNWQFQLPDTVSYSASGYLPFDTNKFNKTERINRVINNVLMRLYVDCPDLVVTTEDRIASRQAYRDEEVKMSSKTSVIELFRPDITVDVGEANLLIRKPNFWYSGGNGSFQMSQNYLSKNWYKGGESTNSMTGNLQLFANYNDKEKLQIENLFEVKVGVNTVPSTLDTMRIYRINTDVFRLSSKIGLQAAFSKWYYTVSGEFNTQIFHNYTANTNDLVSSFMSPANLTFSVGMDYKLKKKKINLSVVVSPFSYNWRYVGSNKVEGTRFGLEEGRHSLNDFGSKLQTTLVWAIVPAVTLNSRLFYFTNYKKVEAEWENTVNFVLNRYLSTKIFLHYRYDDGIPRMEGYNYSQLNELLSFGLNYKW